MSTDRGRSQYSTEFFRRHREGARRSARVVVPMALEYLRPASVVDVGCGDGSWLSVFREFGIDDFAGVDGSYVDESVLEIPRDRFLARDLGNPLDLGRQFDLVVSLEVAEHLAAGCASTFVRSLTGLGPVVLFSAAIPHQGGTHHVNEQWPAYWTALFDECGFVPVDCLRRRLWCHEDVEWWYAQNIMFFVHRLAIPRHPRLAEARRQSDPTPLPLVHPKRFLEWIEWSMSHYDTH